MFITAASTISHQPTFRKEGDWSELPELIPASEIIHPEYSEFIPKMFRRRMSDVLKMALSTSMDCLRQSEIEQPDAIIVGTCMGCCTFTKRFLDKIISSEGGLLSPTSFILSTHNTIAGQISLFLKNHNYNMTHTQNSLSFEQALIDGILCIENGSGNVLVGASDETETDLHNMNERLKAKIDLQACGASFFIISNEKNDSQSVKLIDAGSFGLVENLRDTITDFLDSKNVIFEEIDLVLFSSSNSNTEETLNELFEERKLVDYQKISGFYFTNSAFAMNYGVDILQRGSYPSIGKNIKQILVCNNLIPENLGLILLKSQNSEDEVVE